jgi:glycosyltransferase involved in cell wall biosynthesis
MSTAESAGFAHPSATAVALEQPVLINGNAARRTAHWTSRHAVSFVLPAYNEESNIAEAVLSTVSVGRRYCSAFEVIVVDDGSADDTADVVEGFTLHYPEVRLVRHGMNRGYGEALHTGFRAARLDFIFFTDADNQFDMDELPLLLALADNAEVVAGYRKIRADPPMRLLNAWAWNRMVRLLFYVPVRDIDCAFKLFRRSALLNLEIDSRGAMINTEIMVKLARSGCRIVEVGVSHRARTEGTPQGAKLRVIVRAFREVLHMYPWLTTMGPFRGGVIDLTGAGVDATGNANAYLVPAIHDGDDAVGRVHGQLAPNRTNWTNAALNDGRTRHTQMD